MPILDPSEWTPVVSGAAPPAGGRILDPNEWTPVEAPGKLESFGRGALQGATLGYQDEIAGGLDYLRSGFEPGAYSKGRDEARAANDAARQANPVTYGAGDLAGGVATAFVPGLGIAKGATAAARIGKAALTGAAAGAGYSNAKDSDSLLTDAAMGGAMGAGLGVVGEGVGRVLSRAPLRADNRIIQGVTEGADPSLGKAVVGRAGERRPEVLDTIRADFKLEKAARGGDGDKLLEAARANKGDLLKARDIFYAEVDKAGPKLRPVDTIQALDAAKAKLSQSPSGVGMAKRLDEDIEDIATAWGKRSEIGALELRKEVTKLQDKANAYYRAVAKGGAVPPEAAEAKKIAADALRDLLHEHVERVATQAGLPGVDKLKVMNRQISIISDLENAAASKARKEAMVRPSRLNWMVDNVMGAAPVAALVSGNIGQAAALAGPWLAKKFLLDSGLARDLAMVADDKLANLVRAAQAGARGSQLRYAATQMGIAVPVADAMGLWADQQQYDGPQSGQPY